MTSRRPVLVELTEAQAEAVVEALGFRLADEIEDTAHGVHVYVAALGRVRAALELEAAG